MSFAVEPSVTTPEQYIIGEEYSLDNEENISDAEVILADEIIDSEPEFLFSTQAAVMALTSGDNNPPPEPENTFYTDDFDDGELDVRIEKIGGNGTLVETGGSLVLTRTSTSTLGSNASDGANLYLNSDHSGWKEPLQGVEFTISRDAQKQFNINFRDDNGNDLTSMLFLSTGALNMQYRDEKGGAVIDSKVFDSAFANTDLKINVAFNHILDTLSIWIDDVPVLENKYYKTESDNLCYLNINMEKRNNQAVSLRSFKVYDFVLSLVDKAKAEYDYLTAERLTSEPKDAITQNLTLATEGPFGASIEWGSDLPETISETGEVNRSTESDIDVVLTAKITIDGEILEKQLTVTVKRLIIKQKPHPKNEYLIEDTMRLGTISKLVSRTSGNINATEDGFGLNEGSGFEYFLDSSKSLYSTNLAFEFKLTGTGNTMMEFKDDKDRNNIKLKVENNSLYALIRETETTEPQWTMIQIAVLEESEYTILINPMIGMFSLWYGRDKIVEHQYGAYLTPQISSFKITQNSGNVVMSDYKVYSPEVPDDDAVNFDYTYTEFNTLTYQEITAVSDHLRLNTIGKAGSTITWTSSNENIIAVNGQVNTPESGSVGVVLTAKFSKGTEIMEKTFHVTVVAQTKYELPEVKNMIFEEYFDYNEMSSTWSLTETDGKILVKDEALNITRSSNESTETIADLFMDSEQTTYNGTLGLEYTVEKSDSKLIYFRIRGPVGDYFSANWLADGKLTVMYGTEKDVAPRSITVTTIEDNKAKFTLLFNTTDSTFSLWIDNMNILTNVYARQQEQGIRYARMYLSGTNLMTVKIDNIKFYEAYNLREERVGLDYDWLKKEQIISLTDKSAVYNVISEDLNLFTKGYYGSTIAWESSNEALISNTGKVTPVDSMDADSSVTLTAYIREGEHAKTKEFTFNVIRNVTNKEESVRMDAEHIDYPYISLHENGSKEITRSLYLDESAIYGSNIKWSSSNEKYINKSGRVVRPRFDEKDVPVTLTATISKDGYSITKDFEFTVLADEPFVDPMFMSDEEFFGVWDGESWKTVGKWDYNFPGLEPVGEAAKTGDYTLAKEKLLEYFRNRNPEGRLRSGGRNTTTANSVTDDFYYMYSSHCQGEMWISNEWKPNYANVKTNYISPGATISYSIRSWYNEASYAQIARTSSSDASIRPKLELMVNGKLRTYEAVEDLNIRAGDYRNTNFNNDEYLVIQNFGDFLGNDTRQAVVKFNLSDLKEGERVTSASLVLYSRTLPSFTGEKRLIIMQEPKSIWSSDKATWNTFPGSAYSFNGLPGKNDWERPVGSDVEYWPQMARFGAWETIATEYLLTEDETYAYKAIRIMEDYLFDVGDWRSINRGGTYNPSGLRGGFPRSLDASLKNKCWFMSLDAFLQSEYATPDFCAATLKNIWDTANYLVVYPTESLNNWRQTEYEGVLDTSLNIPEFLDSTSNNNWRKVSSEVLEQTIFDNHLSEGSYIEATAGYNTGAYTGFKSYKSKMLESGAEVSPEYDEMLHKAAYYNALLYAPDGSGLQYGDSSPDVRSVSLFKDIYIWYNDKELEYIITYGNSGVKPSWTSRHWSDSTVTTMRADWSKGSPYLFTNVKGGGAHGHADDNGLIVYAYGRTLLNDAGIFTYSGGDLRKWATSSTAHNTVIMNDRSQVNDFYIERAAHGTVYDFTTNSAFDYLSQSTPQTSGFEHRRTITFIKPNMWIVSDLMTPDENEVENPNNYKQLWHMLPNANLKTSKESNTIFSNYASGANIIVASADGDDVALEEAMGWYDRSYQQLEDAKYAYFEKDNVMGNATFDTVLMPSNEDKTAAATAEKLPTTANATALKINFTTYGSNNTGYYYMTYDGNGGSFGPYETDAQVAYIQENEQGKVTSILLKNGAYIKNNKGEYLLKSDENISEFYIDISGLNVYITTGGNMELSTMRVKADKDISKLFVDEISTSYTMENGNITKIGQGNHSANPEQNVPSAGIKMPQDSPKNQPQPDNTKGDGGGGNGGGGVPNNGGTSEKPIEGFIDTQNHWAKDYIADLKEKGVVNGDDNGYFNPDRSITRGEFVAIVVRALGIEQTSYSGQFADVNETDWYADILGTALENELISLDERFRPNDPITRQEIAKIIASSVNRLNKYNGPDEGFMINYTDSEDVENWAMDAVKYVSYNGLMSGMDDGSFKPKDKATRAETATVISRMLQ